MLYRVEVTITGVIRVEADTPEEAEKLARRAKPMLAGKELFGPKVFGKCAGKVENTTLQPASVKTHQKAMTKPANRPKLHLVHEK